MGNTFSVCFQPPVNGRGSPPLADFPPLQASPLQATWQTMRDLFPDQDPHTSVGNRISFKSLQPTAQELVLIAGVLMDPARRTNQNLVALLAMAQIHELEDLSNPVAAYREADETITSSIAEELPEAAITRPVYLFADKAGFTSLKPIVQSWVRAWCKHSKYRSEAHDKALIEVAYSWQLRGMTRDDPIQEAALRHDVEHALKNMPQQDFL